MNMRPPWFALSLGSIAAVLVATAAGGSSPLRTLIVVWFLLTCPGMVLARLIDLQDGFEEAAVGIGLSIAVNLVVALLLVYLGAWSGEVVFAVIASLSLSGMAAGLAGPRKEPT